MILLSKSVINPTPPITETIYGYLYNFPVVSATGTTSISSSGFSVPLYSDFETLATYMGGQNNCGNELKETGTTYWDDANGLNTVNFNARGAGSRNPEFVSLKYFLHMFIREVHNTNIYGFSLITTQDSMYPFASGVDNGDSIRLLKDNPTVEELALNDGDAASPYVGNDGKTYPTVKIGTQVWLACNLAETKRRNGTYLTGYSGGIYSTLTDGEWLAATEGALCAYDDDLNNV